MLLRQYASSTAAFLVKHVTQFIKVFPCKKVGVYFSKSKITSVDIRHQKVLSVEGDLREAASNLYVTMHRLGELNLDFRITDRFPDSGLGNVIND